MFFYAHSKEILESAAEFWEDDMDHKKRRILLLVIGVTLVIGALCAMILHRQTKKAEETAFITCMEIKEGETVEIEFAPICNGTSRYGYTKKYDSITIKEDYETSVENGMFNLKQILKEHPNISISYGCDEITVMINDDTNSNLLIYIYNIVAPICRGVQSLAGIPLEAQKLKTVLIYEPTGDVAFEFTEFDFMIFLVSSSDGICYSYDKTGKDVLLTQEEWDQRMEEMKK